MLHKMQDWPHSSLPLTPRPPIEGEPGRCKQEVADSVTTAGRTNGMAEMDKPTDTDVDSEKAPLGGDPVERACRVNEGNGTEHEPQSRLQESKFYCKEAHQHSGNANENVPNAYGLPLEGEWEVCASSEARDPRSSMNVPNATPEHVHCPSESSETKDAEGVESEGCKGSTDEPMELLTMSVKPYVEDGELSACICLKGTRMWPGDVDGPGCGTDVSKGLPDGTGAQMDAPSTSNKPETTGLSHREGARMYLGAGDTRRNVKETDGLVGHVETSTGPGDVLNIETYVIKPENETQIVSIPRRREKPPDIPIGPARAASDESDGCRNHADASSACMDTHTAEDETQMAVKETENVRNCQIGLKMQNSLNIREIAMPEPTYQWRRVSIEDIDIYLLWNAPIEALG